MISKCLEDSSAESRETTRESFAEFIKLFPDRRVAVLQHDAYGLDARAKGRLQIHLRDGRDALPVASGHGV